MIRVFSAYDRSGSNRTAFRVHPPGLMRWVEPGVDRTFAVPVPTCPISAFIKH